MHTHTCMHAHTRTHTCIPRAVSSRGSANFRRREGGIYFYSCFYLFVYSGQKEKGAAVLKSPLVRFFFSSSRAANRDATESQIRQAVGRHLNSSSSQRAAAYLSACQVPNINPTPPSPPPHCATACWLTSISHQVFVVVVALGFNKW